MRSKRSSTATSYAAKCVSGRCVVTLHRAEWPVAAAEFASGGAPAIPPDHGRPVERNDAALARLVEQAVARQLGPLRLELQQYADRVRLADLLGGIGFIFGLAGVALWWRSRQPPPGS